MLVVGYLAVRWGQGLGEAGALALAAVLALGVWLANRVVGVAVTGRSLGKALTGLTVVPLTDVDGRVGLGRACGREALTLAYLIPAAGAVGVFLASNPAVDPVGGGLALWLAVALLLPLVSLMRSPLRQCPVTDSLCRTLVLAD